MKVTILQKKEPSVEELCSTLRELREQIPVLETQAIESNEAVINFHVKALSDQGDEAELRELQAKALDAEQRLVAVHRVEMDLFDKIKAALMRDRKKRLDAIDSELLRIKGDSKEMETRVLIARAHLNAILEYAIPNSLEVLHPPVFDSPERREFYRNEQEKIRKELKIGSVSLPGQKSRLFAEAEELRKTEFTDDYIESILVEYNGQCTARSASWGDW